MAVLLTLPMKAIVFLAAVFSVPGICALYKEAGRPYYFEYDDAKWQLVAPSKTPATQDVDKAMEGNTLTTLQRTEADEKYRARISVVVDDPAKATKGKGELADYAKHAVEFLKGQRFDVQSNEPKILPRLGTPAFEIVANQRDFGLTFRQVVFLWETNGKKQAYLLTAATRTNKYDSYKAELDKVFNSFAMQK